jgi:hypothetical protein
MRRASNALPDTLGPVGGRSAGQKTRRDEPAGTVRCNMGSDYCRAPQSFFCARLAPEFDFARRISRIGQDVTERFYTCEPMAQAAAV